MDEMGVMKREGYFNAFHLDYDWENLSDWTELGAPTFLASAKVGDMVEVEVGPVSAKIIGVNLQ